MKIQGLKRPKTKLKKNKVGGLTFDLKTLKSCTNRDCGIGIKEDKQWIKGTYRPHTHTEIIDKGAKAIQERKDNLQQMLLELLDSHIHKK